MRRWTLASRWVLAMRKDQYVYFELNGIRYRTNGLIVEGLDGSTWNRTGSLPVVIAARKAFNTISEGVCDTSARTDQTRMPGSGVASSDAAPSNFPVGHGTFGQLEEEE
jgi:hypothetical protein